MDFEGELVIAAAPDTVWDALVNPQSLIKCVPEFVSLTAVEPGREYEGQASVQFGGRQFDFPLRARWVELEPGRYGRLTAVIIAGGRRLTLTVAATTTANGPQETHLQWRAAVSPPDNPGEPPNFLWQLATNLTRQRLEGFTNCLKNSLEGGR